MATGAAKLGESAHWGGDHGPAPVVAAIAAVNGLGFNPHQTWAFRRAEQTSFHYTPFRDAKGKRVQMAHIRTLPTRTVGAERLAMIAQGAIQQLLAPVAELSRGLRLGVSLALPERMAQRQGGYNPDRARIERVVMEPVRALGFEPAVRVTPYGHAGFAHVVLEAAASLAKNHADAVIVGGLDSYYEPEVVQRLLDQKRLFDGENLNSIIPGEGAAFLLLARREIARQARLPTLATVQSAAVDTESAHMFSEAPCAGLGLSRALRAVVDRLLGERRAIDWWLSDMTAEQYRVHEFQLAFPRASAGVTWEGTTLEFLPVLLGDLGAATMATGAVLACEAFQRGDPDASTCVLTGSSVGDQRGVVLLAREERSGR